MRSDRAQGSPINVQYLYDDGLCPAGVGRRANYLSDASSCMSSVVGWFVQVPLRMVRVLEGFLPFLLLILWHVFVPVPIHSLSRNQLVSIR